MTAVQRFASLAATLLMLLILALPARGAQTVEADSRCFLEYIVSGSAPVPLYPTLNDLSAPAGYLPPGAMVRPTTDVQQHVDGTRYVRVRGDWGHGWVPIAGDEALRPFTPDDDITAMYRELADEVGEEDPTYRHLTSQRFFNLFDYDVAISEATAGLADMPEDAALYDLRGLAHYFNGDLEAAIEDFENAARFTPDGLKAMYLWHLGIAQTDSGAYGEALKSLSTALEQAPTFASALVERGFVHEQMGETDAAIDDYSRAVDIDPLHSYAWFFRGALVFFPVDDPPSALADLNAAIEADPCYEDAYVQRGIIYYFDDALEAARYNLEYAIALDPAIPDAHFWLGSIHARQGNFASAEASFTEAITLAPDYTRAYYNRGQAYEDTRHYDEAIADYEQAIALDPEHIGAHRGLGNIYRALGDDAAAVEAYHQYLALVDGPDPEILEYVNAQQAQQEGATPES